MLTIEYVSNGKAVSDFKLGIELARVIDLSSRLFDGLVQYSTSNIFEMVMLYITQGKIDWQKVQFLFEGQRIKFDEYIHLDCGPDGFLFDYVKIDEEFLRAKFTMTSERGAKWT